jgi:hypothetical protein
LTDGQVVPTLNDGQTVEVSIEQDQLDDVFGEWLDWLFPWLSSSDTTLTTVKINDSTVTLPDISATNGVIHVIDSVLIPQDLQLVYKIFQQRPRKLRPLIR